MQTVILIVIGLLLTLILIQYLFVKKLKSKKGQLIKDLDGELGNILSKNKKTMIYFWTESCSVCRKQMPIIKELSTEFKNIFFYNLSNDPNTARKIGIMAVPAIIFVDEYKITDILVGAQSKENLKTKLMNFFGV